MRPEATVELGDDAPQLERERDLHHAGHEREGRDERQQRDCPRAGMTAAGGISRADLAAFMFETATQGSFLRMKPLVSQ